MVSPILRQLRVFERDGLSAAGEQAREELASFVAQLDKTASRFVERREANRARTASRGTTTPAL